MADGKMTVGVLGAGAVGCFFGARLAQGGVDVALVARPQHQQAIARDGLVVVSGGTRDVVPMEVHTDVRGIASRDVVLVTVKSVDTEAAADLIAAHVPTETMVVSLQNGVDNAWRLQARLPRHAVVPGVVYVSAEMTGPGAVQHNGAGRLIVGAPLGWAEGDAAANAAVDRFVAACVAAGVPCARSADVRLDLWMKLATNCAYNAMSALTGLRYGVIAAREEARALMTAVTDELVAVAHAEGVALDAEAAHAAVWKIADVMPGALSSTAQDIQAGRRTEIDSLNGYVARCGAAKGVPTPANRTLAVLVRLREQAPRGGQV